MSFTKTLLANLTVGMIVGALGCATLSRDEQPKLELAISDRIEFQDVKAEFKTGLGEYEFQGQKFVVEWLACRRDGAKGAILVQHRDQFGFDSQSFCQGWVAQAGLAGGWNVMGINRPGYGKSTGYMDFAGAQSIAAIGAGVSAARAVLPEFKDFMAAWGYSSGAIAAAQYARQVGKIPWLIIGAGIFDTEQTLTTTGSAFIKDNLSKIVAVEGSGAHQIRSIAWDTQGLPPNLMLYHGAADDAVPVDRATAFRDSMASAGYKVELTVLPDTGRELPFRTHRDFLSKVFQRIQ
jgi:hypothetical protein